MSTTIASSTPSLIAPKTQKPTKESSSESEDKAPLSPAGLLYTKEDKDTLAFEHDRQAHKKTLDRARNKARKAFGWGSGNNTRASSRARGGNPTPHGQTQSQLEGRRLKGEKEEDRELAEGEYLPSPAIARRKGGEGVTKAVEELSEKEPAFWVKTPFTEVRLADLVLQAATEIDVNAGSGRSRKDRKKPMGGLLGKGGLDGEFEVVPHMRSVIVLDEQQFPVGLDLLGDPWECVEDESSSSASSGEEAVVGKKASGGAGKASYAKVAAAAMSLDK